MRDFTAQQWVARSGKASAECAPAYPVTGIPPGIDLHVQSMINWSPGGVVMQGITHREDGDPVYFGTPTTRLYRAGRT